MDGLLGKEYLKNYIKNVKSIINNYLKNEEEKAKDVGKIPAEAVEHFNNLAAEGKGIRGCLVSLGYEANGGTKMENIYETSTFIEIFHSGVLVHDDFMDRDNKRRGVETLNSIYKKYGEKIKVKTDPLHYAKYVIRLAHGQVLDITSGAHEDITEKEVLNILWTKSGEYTSLLPLMVGATLVGDIPEKRKKAIENYARCFGWAFQIQDDYLGIFGEEEETRKPITSDLREGKNTLFMFNLRKLGNNEQKAFQSSVLGREDVTKDDVYKMREILRDSGTLNNVLKKGWAYVEEGKKYIGDITDDKNMQNIFESLLVFMMERTK